MDTNHSDRSRGDNHEQGNIRRNPGLPGSGMTFVLIAIAVLFAIAFFYMTKVSQSDRRAEAVTEAAASVDNATSSIGRAAEKAAGKLRQDR